MANRATMIARPVAIGINGIVLSADLSIPAAGAQGLIIFVHGSGSGRHSPRNRFVADELGDAGFATLLIDLLTREEDRIDSITAEFRFDIELLSNRVVGAIDWAGMQTAPLGGLSIGLFGASTGAAAAVIAAAARPSGGISRRQTRSRRGRAHPHHRPHPPHRRRRGRARAGAEP